VSEDLTEKPYRERFRTYVEAPQHLLKRDGWTLLAAGAICSSKEARTATGRTDQSGAFRRFNANRKLAR
jgi:hypothetical protein